MCLNNPLRDQSICDYISEIYKRVLSSNCNVELILYKLKPHPHPFPNTTSKTSYAHKVFT